MSTIKERVKEILARRAKSTQVTNLSEVLRIINEINVKNLEFEESFKDVLPLLNAENITWIVKAIDERYTHKGFYVEFKNCYNNRVLKMDFFGKDSYRYCFSEYGEVIPIAYGKWGMDDFLIYIYDNLIA